MGFQGGKISDRSERQGESLTPKWLVICVFFRHLNSLQPPRRLPSFSLAKVPQCAKLILRRCIFRHLKRRAHFSQAKEAVEIIQLQHPLVYDQYDL